MWPVFPGGHRCLLVRNTAESGFGMVWCNNFLQLCLDRVTWHCLAPHLRITFFYVQTLEKAENIGVVIKTMSVSGKKEKSFLKAMRKRGTWVSLIHVLVYQNIMGPESVREWSGHLRPLSCTRGGRWVTPACKRGQSRAASIHRFGSLWKSPLSTLELYVNSSVCLDLLVILWAVLTR